MSTARIAADVRADAREREPGGRRWAFATILAAVIAVGFAWYLVGRDGDQPIIATNSAQGEKRLADGTRVTLMDGARIETRFRSEEHTSELQSLMRISYAVFCLKKKHHNNPIYQHRLPLKRNTTDK